MSRDETELLRALASGLADEELDRVRILLSQPVMPRLGALEDDEIDLREPVRARRLSARE